MMFSALGAGEVVTTDGNEDVLKLADDNIRINADPLDKNHIIRTAQLRWSTDDEKAFVEKHWDYIIASDVTYRFIFILWRVIQTFKFKYRKSSWTDLIGTIRRLSSPGTIAILSMVLICHP
jgi:predicted nicotinamide N-methyase